MSLWIIVYSQLVNCVFDGVQYGQCDVYNTSCHLVNAIHIFMCVCVCVCLCVCVYCVFVRVHAHVCICSVYVRA